MLYPSNKWKRHLHVLSSLTWTHIFDVGSFRPNSYRSRSTIFQKAEIRQQKCQVTKKDREQILTIWASNKKKKKAKNLLGLIRILWSWMIPFRHLRKKFQKVVKLAQSNHFPSLRSKSNLNQLWLQAFLNQLNQWSQKKKLWTTMINYSRRPHLGLKKDQTTKQLLLHSIWSLPSLKEASKKICSRKHHPEPHPKKKSLHQLESL